MWQRHPALTCDANGYVAEQAYQRTLAARWHERDRREQAKALAREAQAYLARSESADAELLMEIRAWRAEHDR